MVTALLLGSGPRGNVGGNNPAYAPMGSAGVNGNLGSTESLHQAKTDLAGTASLMSCSMNKGNSGTFTVRFRINTANGNQVATTTATTTDFFQDATHSDSIAAGDIINWSAGFATFASTFYTVNCAFTGTSTAKTFYNHYAAVTFSTASVNNYIGLFGHGGNSTTETSVTGRCLVRAAGTLSRHSVNVSANTTTNACTSTVRINASNGNGTVSITGSTTGFFEDTTHTDSIASNDNINTLLATPSGTVSLTLRSTGCTFTPGDGTSMEYGYAEPQTSDITTTAHFSAPVGGGSTSTTENQTQMWMAVGTTLSNLRAYLSGTGAGSTTWVTRINGATGNQSAGTVSAGFTYVEDSTHSDTFVVGDKICTQATTASSNASTGAIFYKAGVATVAYTLTATKGTYAYTGVTAGLNAALKMSCATGSYGETGVALANPFALVPGAYAYTGNPVTFATGHTAFTMACATGNYTVFGKDTDYIVNYTLHSSFAEFNRTDFKDWGTTNFPVFFQASYMIPNNINWSQTPYVYTFMKQADDSDETSESLNLNLAWNWQDDDASARITRDTQLYKFHNGFLVSATKHKMRGKGRSIQARFTGEDGKNFNILGWAILVSTNVTP